jgi:hypothetical protein
MDPQTMMPPELVVVSDAPMTDVVPLIIGVIVILNGGGCTELVKTMSPVI